jgi:P27 family predicted phage terminase small subunit
MGRVYKTIPPPPGAKILGWDPKNVAGLAVAEPPAVRYASPYDDPDEVLGGEPLDWGDVPPELDEVGVEKWQRLARTFARSPGRFREGDREIVTTYCDVCSLAARASAEMKTEGVVVAGRSKPDQNRGVKNPAAQIHREMVNQQRQLFRQLGLDPTSRARMKSPLPQRPADRDDSPFMPNETR